MKIALGEWNFDAVFAESFLDGVVDFTTKTSRILRHFSSPNAQFEVERTVAESDEKDIWRWIGQHLGVSEDDRGHEGSEFLDVGSVGNADGNSEANFGIAVTPIDYGFTDEARVGHDDRNVVIGDDDRAAKVNAIHPTGHAVDFNAVTDRDGTFG